ncbi:MAG TPA: hypothetical protein VFL42_03190, partial [Terriglobales bacterium]|nr:hypothetical protein [Terriglobales bacterium]
MSETRERTTPNTETRTDHGDAMGKENQPSAHIDPFAQQHLPPKELWPVMKTCGINELEYPTRLNAAA